MGRGGEGLDPLPLANLQRLLIDDSLGDRDPLQRGEPAQVVTGAIGRLAAARCSREPASQSLGPLAPGIEASRRKRHSQRERLRLPWRRKDRSVHFRRL